MIRNMLENLPNIWKPMNRLKYHIFLLTTNLSWWLMKQKNELTVSTVSLFTKLNFLEWTQQINHKILDFYTTIKNLHNVI